MSGEKKIYVIGHCEIKHLVRGMPFNPKVSEPFIFKIGIAQDPEKRMRELQTGNPQRLELATIIESDQPARVENTLHRIYQECKHRGEWYTLPINAVNSLKALDRIDPDVLESVREDSRQWRYDTSLYVAYKSEVRVDA